MKPEARRLRETAGNQPGDSATVIQIHPRYDDFRKTILKNEVCLFQPARTGMSPDELIFTL